MKNILRLTVIFLCSMPLFAAIDPVSEDLDSELLSKQGDFQVIASKDITDHILQITPGTIVVPPLQLNRNISVLSKYSRLPEDYQRTLKQYHLNYEGKHRTQWRSSGIRLDDINSDANGQALTFGLLRNWDTPIFPMQGKTFLETVHTESSLEPTDTPHSLFSIGAEGQTALFAMDINARLSYEEQLVKRVASSSAITAQVTSKIPLHRVMNQTELHLRWNYAEDREMNDELQALYTQGHPKGELYAPDIDNISIMNVSLAMAPSTHTFMSVDYYHYLQDQLQIQSFSNNANLLETPEYTTGSSHDLGQELNLKAVYAHSENLVSRLFAGWFEPGDAYGQADDKTFEIRGEIIVNF